MSFREQCLKYLKILVTGLDLDFGTPAIRDEIIRWGKWFTDATRADGYRVDAVKHIDAYYQRDWIRAMRAHTGREMFTVGEYWSGDLSRLMKFLDQVSLSVPFVYPFVCVELSE